MSAAEQRLAASPGAATRQRIIEAAEQLFAEEGIKGASLRSIMARAQVNIAAINYHFGSKDVLVEAVFARTAVPLVEERMRLLDQCAPGPGRPPLLEQIIEAFLRPVLKDSHDIGGRDARFSRIRALLVAEAHDFANELIDRYFSESIRRFQQAVRVALPELSERDLQWRYQFMMGALIYALANPARLQQLTGADNPPGEALAQFVSLSAMLFRALNSYPVGGTEIAAKTTPKKRVERPHRTVRPAKRASRPARVTARKQTRRG